jgi:DNA-binding response OmpR family regulator
MNKQSNLAKILVVDDDINICNLITRFLKNKSYEIESANDGKTALEIFQQFLPDLVILDINLPDILGYNLCEKMQKINNAFVLMLTSRNELEDIQRGFAKGADDFLTKPFNVEELNLRIQAILKRQRLIKSSPDIILTINNLTIDPKERKVMLDDNNIPLTTLEFDLLYFLAKNPNRVWRREELINHIWNDNSFTDNRVVDVHIGQIRRKIKPQPDKLSQIITIRGVGYKFQTIDQ